MWAVICLWVLKLKYKKRIKRLQRRNPGMSSNDAVRQIVAEQIGKDKRKLLFINISIVSILAFMLSIVIVSIIALTSFMNNLGTIASLVSMGVFDEPKVDDEGNVISDGWSWDDILDDDDITNGGSGGLYPKDRDLRIRAQMIELATNVALSTGKPIESAWLLGVGTRETNGGQYVYSGSNNPDVFKDLVMVSDPCGWIKSYGECSYITHNHSMYEGGTVVSGKENGSPYTMKFDQSMTKYEVGKKLNNQTIGHAIGPFQFEIIYVYDTVAYKYQQTSKSSPSMDNSLGFIRPNPLYMPDAIQSNAMLHVLHWNTIESNSKTLKSSEFRALSDKNQNIIKFSLAGSMYGVGGWKSWMDDFAKQLVEVGKTKELDRLLDSNKYWNSTKLAATYNGHTSYISDLQSAGIKWTYNTSSSYNQYQHFPWSGLAAVNLGRIEYDKLKALIDAAEKDGTSGGIGSGVQGDKHIPVKKGYVSSQFGWRKGVNPKNHEGTDIGGCAGEALYVPLDCKVLSAGYDSMMGNYTKLQPVGNSSLVITFMHMQSLPQAYVDSTTVALTSIAGKDTILKSGTAIGFVGNTGNSKGAHLHLQVNTVNLNDRVTGSPDTFSPNGAIPPFPAIYGSEYKSILNNTGIELGKALSESTLEENNNLKWRGIPLKDYFI